MPWVEPGHDDLMRAKVGTRPRLRAVMLTAIAESSGTAVTRRKTCRRSVLGH